MIEVLSFIAGIILGIGWSFHDSLRTKIRYLYARWVSNGVDVENRISDISLYSKGIKALLFIGAIFAYWYLTYHFVLAFIIYWFILFDQGHAKFVRGRFLNWNEYLDQHILHRAYQWFERRIK